MILKRRTKLIALIICIFIIIFYLEYRINTDSNFHYGKDEGFFIRIKTILIFSPIFFLIMAKHKKIIMMLLGLLIGFVSIIISYLFSALFVEFRYSGLIFSLLSALIYIVNFFLIEKKWRTLLARASSSCPLGEE